VRSLSRALRGASVSVDRVTSPADLARRDHDAPGLVYVDLEFPDVSIEDIVSGIRQTFPRASVIALGTEIAGDLAARLLGLGVPSVSKPVSPMVLTELALRVLSNADRAPRGRASGEATNDLGRMEPMLGDYSRLRLFSHRQQAILKLYLNGQNDKEIAYRLQCAASTVYEHWRRMAKKTGGAQKGDVVADFHRFLANDERAP
jgi:DNA-binding NarL/FixJ family response regulator